MPVNSLGSLGGEPITRNNGTTLGTLGNGVRGSWYSQLPDKGWVDRQDKPGSSALGVPDAQQGIALPTRKTLGQWFMVTAPDGTTHRLQQTDIGPAASTGRGVDISAAAADRMGYTPKTFPTDARFVVAPTDAPDGWQTNVGPSSSGVGYVNPGSVAQGATTDPADLMRQPDSRFDFGEMLRNFDFRPAQVRPAPTFSFDGQGFVPRPLGGQRRG